MPHWSQEILGFNKSEYQGLGENLWLGGYSYEYKNYEAAANNSVTSWYNEKKNYDYATLTCQGGACKCGHYTQVRNYILTMEYFTKSVFQTYWFLIISNNHV